MLVSFFLGFFLGIAALVAVEVLAALWIIHRLRRKGPAVDPREAEVGRDLEVERAPTYPCNKQGVVWVIEPEKVPKVNTDGSPTRGSKEQKHKKNIVEVFPAKKFAKIKDHVLILSDQDGSQATMELLDCMVVAVSASNLSSRKWAKRYPIRLESKDSVIYGGSKICYLYVDTSWEKESWCKALRLASCPDKRKWHWFSQLSEEFHNYVASLNAEYPSFLKPSALSCEATDKTSRIDGSSRVRLFLKKLAKKASTKTGVESKTSSASSSARGETRVGDKLRSLNDASLTDGLVKSSLEDKSLSYSLQDSVQPPSPRSAHLGNKSLFPIFSDAVCDENFVSDEGTLCWNLLFSRLFFDAKKSDDVHNAIKTRIQRTLSNMRTPCYIGEVTCTDLDLGNIPPYIHKMRVLPMDLNEVWAMEVDIEYSGGVLLDIETRLEVCEPELQKDIINTTLGPSSSGDVNSELLEGIEHYRDQLKFSNNTAGVDNIDEGDKVDGFKQSRSTSWRSSYVSRWKAILHSIADQVSQVPLSLAIRVASLRGTLRLHIKPPPSDQLWFGFTSMPEIDWNLESSVGDRKITNSHIALLIGNRFKASVRETLVLPNCESLCIPWMLAEKDDWVPREVAPFVWISQEASDVRGPDLSNSQHEEAKPRLDGNNRSKAGPAFLDKKIEKEKNAIQVEQPPQESISEFSTSHGGSLASVSDGQSSFDSINEELRIPLLRTNETQESCDQSGVESPRSSSSSAIVTTVEETTIPSEEDAKPKKITRRARMKEIGKRMGDKLEEKRRHLEEKSRHIVEKMRDNTRT